MLPLLSISCKMHTGRDFQNGKSLIGGGSLGAKNLNSHEWKGRTLLNLAGSNF